jgi:hypothetical protein
VRKQKRATVEDALRAWEIAGQGGSLRYIAKTMGLSGPQQAKNLLERGFQDFYSPLVNQRRAEIEEGTRQLLPVFFKRAAKGDSEAAREWRALIEVLRKLHGLDAPTRTELSGKNGAPLSTSALVTLTDEQLARLARGQSAGAAGDGDLGDPPPGAPED